MKKSKSMLSPDSALLIENVASADNLTPDRPESKRKFSFPVVLHSSSLLSEVSARRRFSNVSDVVSRKLSNTIGWKLPSVVPTQDIVTQGKCLCGQYIRFRLKRSGLFNKKLGLQRIRSIIGTASIHVVRDVFPALNFVSRIEVIDSPAIMAIRLPRWARSWSGCIRRYLRASRGRYRGRRAASCRDRSRRLCCCSQSRAISFARTSRGRRQAIITRIPKKPHLHRLSVQVIALFAISGGLAVDCIRQGHPEYLPKLVEGIADVIEDELAAWISENDGWVLIHITFGPAIGRPFAHLRSLLVFPRSSVSPHTSVRSKFSAPTVNGSH